MAVVGTGAIGRAVADALADGDVPGLTLGGVLARGGPADGLPRLADVDALLAARPHAVVECASHEAVRTVGPAVLGRGIHLVCVSVGALADDDLRERLERAASEGGARLLVPSGAVGALDLLAAARISGLESVEIEQRKPARALLPADEAASLTGPVTLFEGSVREVVARHPRTTNVAAAVALAGLGFERTVARVVADPAARANHTVLRVRGAAGSFVLTIDNVPSANPRTSAVVAGSVLATLARLASPLVVPA